MERQQVEIDNRIRNEIDNILHIINLPVQEGQENNEEQQRQGERRNNSLLNINMMNQMFINSMMRDIQARAEEDDLQEAIMRSIEDS